MGLFSRRREQKEQEQLAREHEALIEELSKPPCQQKGGHHLFRDFPPVTAYAWNGMDTASYIELRESYVCVFCGERVTKTLEKITYTHSSYDEFFKKYDEFKDKYKDIVKPMGIVEDMINDAIMVDRQKLMYWEQLHAPTPHKKEKFEFKVGRENDIGQLITEEQLRRIKE